MESDPHTHSDFPEAIRPLMSFWVTLMHNHMIMPRDFGEWLDMRENYHEQYKVWSGKISVDAITHPTLKQWIEDHGPEPVFAAFEDQIKQRLRGRRFCTTKKGHMAMVPVHADRRDMVSILFGADVPLILRRDDFEPSRFELIGTAYVERIMFGNLIEKYEEGLLEKTVIELV